MAPRNQTVRIIHQYRVTCFAQRYEMDSCIRCVGWVERLKGRRLNRVNVARTPCPVGWVIAIPRYALSQKYSIFSPRAGIRGPADQVSGGQVSLGEVALPNFTSCPLRVAAASHRFRSIEFAVCDRDGTAVVWADGDDGGRFLEERQNPSLC
jgi:hypothetical protein